MSNVARKRRQKMQSMVQSMAYGDQTIEEEANSALQKSQDYRIVLRKAFYITLLSSQTEQSNTPHSRWRSCGVSSPHEINLSGSSPSSISYAAI